MRNEPSHNDSDLSRPSASVIDEARGILILKRTYAKGVSHGFLLACVLMAPIAYGVSYAVRHL